MTHSPLTLENIPRISAIYFALLQCGYDYYALGRDQKLVQSLQSFIAVDAPSPFSPKRGKLPVRYIPIGRAPHCWKAPLSF